MISASPPHLSHHSSKLMQSCLWSPLPGRVYKNIKAVLSVYINMMFDNYARGSYSHSNVIVPSSGARGCLMLGDFNSATDIDNIRTNNIKTVITAATNMDHLEVDKSVRHIVYPLLDAKTEVISNFFEDNFDNIETSLKRGGVLVHCAAGVSRSATLVIAYLMKKNSWGFKEAIAFVRKSRPQVCPNLGFEMQLKKYEKQLSKKTEDRFSKTVVSGKNNVTTTSFNEFMTSQKTNGFPNIQPFSRGKSRPRHGLKSRPYSKDQHVHNTQNEQLLQKGLMITSLGFSMKPRFGNYHSSSVYKNTNEIERKTNASKKIAALMFQSKLSQSLGPNSSLRKSDIKITGFR